MAVDIKKRPTLKTIAYMTGLGVTTVSKALKDAPDIKASTKQRVKLIAEQIGYQPDRAGQRLRTGKTNVINLTLSANQELTSMKSQFILGAMEALDNTPYNLVLSPYSRDADPMESVRHIVETRSADGIILSLIETHDQRLAYLDKMGMPFVTHGRSTMGLEHAYVDFDCERFGNDSVELLAGIGCKRIALISGSSVFTFCRLIREGFNKGLCNMGVTEYPQHTVTLFDSVEQVADSAYEILRQGGDSPDAFVCGSVSAAIGVSSAIERAGLTVGKDINIVAKQSPARFLKWFGRQIYTVDDDFQEAGYRIAESLVKVIDVAPVTDHQTIIYPDKWGELVTE